MELISVRSNQTFGVNYESNMLTPFTEVIILVSQPKYDLKGQKIIKTTELQEIRFESSTEGINILIGQLQQALKVANNYSQMGGAINDIIANSKPKEDSAESK